MKPSDNLVVWRLLYFLGKTESLTQASIQTDLELSAASRLLSALEKELGVMLIDRSCKPFKLLPITRTIGTELHDLIHLQKTVKERLTRSAAPDKQKVFVRLSAPSNIPRGPMLQHIEAYTQAMDPSMTFELYNDLDHTDVLTNQVDVAFLPYFAGNVPELCMMPFLTGVNLMFASPEYLAKHGEPKEPEELVKHRLYFRRSKYYPVTRRLFSLTETFDLETGKRERIPDHKTEKAAFQAIKDTSVRYGTPHRKVVKAFYGDCPTCVQAAVAGMGIAVDLSFGVCDDLLRSGLLVPVMKNWHRPLWINTLCLRERDAQDERLMRFVRWFAAVEHSHGNKRWQTWYRHYGLDPTAVLNLGL